jgi:Ran GTPase-activating protein (RanGAP) involved in mRNA processing and transport
VSFAFSCAARHLASARHAPCITADSRPTFPRYEKAKFGMKLSDVTSLAKACRLTETLTILSLPGNLLDDPAVRVLAGGLADNSTVTALDLSHNKIADRGAKAIAKLLDGPSVLVSLNLADNAVHADGGRYFGLGLRGNCSLQHLNLRLNRLGDDGGRQLLDGALDNDTLSSLNMSCNALDFHAAQAACAVLANPRSGLRSLDLSGNLFSEEAGRILLDTVSSNGRLTNLDLRLNQVLAETVASIEELCKRNVVSQAEQRAAAAANLGA